MRRTILLTLIASSLCGCNMHSDLLPFLGKWSGKYEVASIVGAGSDKDRAREQLHGWVQIYETNRSYKMEMEGEQESIKVDGNWTIKGNRITLNPKSIVIDDMGGADARDPNKKYIPSDDVRDAYGNPLVLVESKDKKSLSGLEMTIGKLVGKHDFVKDSF